MMGKISGKKVRVGIYCHIRRRKNFSLPFIVVPVLHIIGRSLRMVVPPVVISGRTRYTAPPMFSLNYKIGVEDDPKSYEYAHPENDPTNKVGVYFNVIQIKRKA